MNQVLWSPPTAPVTAQWLATEFRPDLALLVSHAEQRRFDGLCGGPHMRLVLYGAGNLGRRTLAGLRRAGIEPLAFVDSSPAIQGTEVDDKPVMSPADAARELGDNAAFVVTIWSPSREHVIGDISRSLHELGVHRVMSFVPLFWRHAAEFLPYACLDLPHRLYNEAQAIRDAESIFEDADSREQFRLQLSYLLSTMDAFDIPRRGVGGSYFPSDLVTLSPQEVFVDCGAYDGDTLASFLEATGGDFGRIVAFEPDPHAFAVLTAFVGEQPADVRDRIRLEQRAVGGAAERLHFDGGGTPGSRISDTGSLVVQSVTLDGALSDLAPTFIKMDIEGAEEGALLGAAQAIRDHRPVLAVCIYHLQSDLYRLPTLLARLAVDYRFFLRRQGDDGDLVCFAIPNERVNDVQAR